MVTSKETKLDRTLAALADPTRRALLARLAKGEARVTDLAQPFGVSLNAISKHIRVLEQAGLVQREIRGREHFLSLDTEPMNDVRAWMEEVNRFWSTRLNALERLMNKADRKGGSHG